MTPMFYIEIDLLKKHTIYLIMLDFVL